jgi:hypothetical protein
MVVLASVMFLFKLTQPSNDDLIKDGKYWSTDCTLKEVDIPTGFLTSNINRLDCSGVVVNVVKEKYDRQYLLITNLNSRDERWLILKTLSTTEMKKSEVLGLWRKSGPC